jgi:hypothetical protein
MPGRARAVVTIMALMLVAGCGPGSEFGSGAEPPRLPERTLVRLFRERRAQFDALAAAQREADRVNDSLGIANGSGDSRAYAAYEPWQSRVDSLAATLDLKPSWVDPGRAAFYQAETPRIDHGLGDVRGYLHSTGRRHFRMVENIDVVSAPKQPPQESMLTCRGLRGDWYLCRSFWDASQGD